MSYLCSTTPKVLTSRKNVWKNSRFNARYKAFLGNDRVTTLFPVRSHDQLEKAGWASSSFAFVLVEEVVFVAQGEYMKKFLAYFHLTKGPVLSIHQKTGGRYGKHVWVESVSNIGMSSNIATQVFEHGIHSQFRAIHWSMLNLRCPRFELLPPANFLFALEHTPAFTSAGDIVISAEDSKHFTVLTLGMSGLTTSVKALVAQQKKGNFYT